MPVQPYQSPLWNNVPGTGASTNAKRFLNTRDYFEFNGVSYVEKAPNSPTFSFDKDGNSRCVREFYIPWQGQGYANSPDPFAIWTAAKTLLGYPVVNAPQPSGFPEAITLNGTVTVNTTTITMGVFANALRVGQTVVGSGIPAGTAITRTPFSSPASAAGTIKISNTATVSSPIPLGISPLYFAVQVVNLLGSTVSGSTYVTDLSYTTQLVFGEAVTGPNIVDGTVTTNAGSFGLQGQGCSVVITVVAGAITSATILTGGGDYPPSDIIKLSVLQTGASRGRINVTTNASGEVNGFLSVAGGEGGSGYVDGSECDTSSVVVLSQAATATGTNVPLRFGTYKYISRIIPHSMENFMGFPNFFFATSIGKVDGTVPDGIDAFGTGQSVEAMLSVVYSSPPYNILDDTQMSQLNNGVVDESTLYRYVTANIQAAGKWQSIPSFSALQWQPGQFTETNPNGPGTITYNVTSAGPAQNIGTVFLSQADISIDWHEVPLSAIPWGVIRRAEGCTNLYAFGGVSNPANPLSIIGQRPAGTLVLLTSSFTLRRLITGEMGATISYKFKFYPNGANAFYNFYRTTSQGYIPGFQKAARTPSLVFLGNTVAFNFIIQNLPPNAAGVIKVGNKVSGPGIQNGAVITGVTQTGGINGLVDARMSLSASITQTGTNFTFGDTTTFTYIIPSTDFNMLLRPQQDFYDF